MLAGLRDRDLSPAFLALFLVLAFLELAFLALVLEDLLAERRRAGCSGVVSGAGSGAAADIAAGCDRPRPSPMLLANWDRRSE